MNTNISFSSNVNIIKSTSQQVGDKVFLNKIKDYYALLKLMRDAGGLNTGFYLFKHSQTRIISPDFSGTYVPRREDPAVLAENKRLNAEYGYESYDSAQLFPLIDETYLNYGTSIWKVSGPFWWKTAGFYKDNDSGKIGSWQEVATQPGTVELFGGGTLFTTYLKQDLERAGHARDTYISISEASFEELYEPDPYYYIYQKTAGVHEEPEAKHENKEASAYLQKYGFYSAFQAVEQDRIIKAPASENIFVDAGPGTGKTYTLIQKINYMVEQLDVDPEGILVLCFTNAAVAEIKKRRDEYVAAGGNRGLRKVDIRTFHSFAWWLIGEANSSLVEDGWKPINMHTLSYDGSISRATQIIRQFAEQVLGGWEHFIVDEIQDLTDVRARLVLQIVKSCLETGCGITALGDSCQAIYDYNQTNVINPLESKEFYEQMFHLLYDKGSFCKLTLNHRQTDNLIALTSELREAILNEKPSEMKAATRNLYDRMQHFGGSNFANSVSEDYLHTIAGNENVCLLCRNNAQVLRLSAQLRKRGVQHTVNAYDHNRCFAAWIGHIFSSFTKEQISIDEFASLYATCPHTGFSADEVWSRMATMLHKPDNLKLGTAELLRAIYNSQIDDPVFHNYHTSKIIVSNIHKAKGREYNAVIVEEQFIKGLFSNRRKDIGEFKTLYVAVTRPKTRLSTANMVSGDGVRLFDIWKTHRKRWVKHVYKKLTYLEIRGNTDINVESYNKLGESVQEYVATSINIGDEIILRKSKASEIFRYNIIHVKNETETVIGQCTTMLEEDLEALLDTEDNFQWPAEIRDLYVNDVYTHISRGVDTVENTLGSDNVWNWVDFCGLGRLVYDVY